MSANPKPEVGRRVRATTFALLAIVLVLYFGYIALTIYRSRH